MKILQTLIALLAALLGTVDEEPRLELDLTEDEITADLVYGQR